MARGHPHMARVTREDGARPLKWHVYASAATSRRVHAEAAEAGCSPHPQKTTAAPPCTCTRATPALTCHMQRPP
eukprot:1215292-Prymnesium_polylepis.2